MLPPLILTTRTNHTIGKDTKEQKKKKKRKSDKNPEDTNVGICFRYTLGEQEIIYSLKFRMMI